MILKIFFACCFLMFFSISNGIGQTSFGNETVITSSNRAASALQNHLVVDLNQDGRLDLLIYAIINEKIAWYRNLGNGNFSIQKVISVNNSDDSEIAVADLDGDGSLDIITVYDDHNIGWYKNNGSELFFR
ncbi:MAG: VCBS repeat-containing protein [Chitinophagales bacterium]